MSVTREYGDENNGPDLIQYNTDTVTATLSPTDNAVLDDISANTLGIGAKADAEAGTDTGTFSLIALFKHLLTKTSTMVTSLGTMITSLGTILTNTGTIATNTTNAATTTKQDTGNTTLSTIATNTTSIATSALQTTGNTSIANVDTNLGAKADAAASTDTGTFSLIALFKRLLQGITTLGTNTTNIATSANQTTANSSLSTIATNTGRIPAQGAGATAASLAVNIASDQNVPVIGNVASGATDSGAPVKVAGKFNSSQPTFTDGQRGDFQLDSRGNVKMVPYGNNSATPISNLADNADGVATSATANKLATASKGYSYNRVSAAYDRTTQAWLTANKTATGAASAAAGTIHTVTISPLTAVPTAGLVTIYDNASAASGTILHSEWVFATGIAHTVTLDKGVSNGIYVSFDGTLANVGVGISYI